MSLQDSPAMLPVQQRVYAPSGLPLAPQPCNDAKSGWGL